MSDSRKLEDADTLTKILHMWLSGHEARKPALDYMKRRNIGITELRVEIGEGRRQEIIELRAAVPATWQTLVTLAHLKLKVIKGKECQPLARELKVPVRVIELAREGDYSSRDWIRRLAALPDRMVEPAKPRGKKRKPPEVLALTA